MNRNNNFDFLRLIFAAFVIITHSYVLSGTAACDWLCRITNGQLSFSYIGLRGFFIISGYLVFQSLARCGSVFDYYWKRFLRLFPGLVVVLLITVFLAPFVYKSSYPYLYNNSVWTYIPNNLSLYNLQYNIGGVFENNPYKSAVNGNLWTLAYEFTFYILLSLLFFLKNKKKLIIILATYFLFFVGNIFFLEQFGKYNFLLNGRYILDLGFYFFAGSALAVVNFSKIKYSNLFLYISVLLLFFSLIFKLSPVFIYLSLPIIIVALGLKATPIISNMGNKIGDLSYGMYIYGFPIQQTLEHFFNFKHTTLMITSIIMAGVMGYFSWHLVEKNFLKLKNIKFKNEPV